MLKTLFLDGKSQITQSNPSWLTLLIFVIWSAQQHDGPISSEHHDDMRQKVVWASPAHSSHAVTELGRHMCSSSRRLLSSGLGLAPFGMGGESCAFVEMNAELNPASRSTFSLTSHTSQGPYDTAPRLA